MLKFFRIPFATSGDKTAVPDDSQPSGSVSYTDGFGPDYELDPGVDPAAKDVPRDESNQLYFDITTAIAELQSFGTPDFITSALNDGSPFSYAKYARMKFTDNKVYESTVNANTTDPTSSPASWRVITDNVDYLAIATTAFQASVTDGEAVYWDGTQFDEAVADGTNKQNVIGFADVTNGRVFVAGLYSGQLSGLTANVAYYLSTTTPGAITSSVGPVRIGVSRTSTSMFVTVGAGAGLASETVPGIVEKATTAEAQAFTADKYIDGQRLGQVVVGANQTWQDVSASRASAVNYTNSTGKPIMVNIVTNPTTTTVSLTVDGVTVAVSLNTPDTVATRDNLSAMVPNGSVYRLSAGVFEEWAELR
jgi:hypothetical protein